MLHILLSALLSTQAIAFPVVTDQPIQRDDKDANAYYFYPERMVLGSDPASKRKQYGCFEDGATAYVTGSFTFEISDKLKQSFAEIKSKNPKANIAPLSFRETKFVDQHVTNVIIACDGKGITIGANVACAWQLNGAHACSAFQKEAARSPGIHILDLNFTYRGIVQGQLKDVSREIPVMIFDL